MGPPAPQGVSERAKSQLFQYTVAQLWQATGGFHKLCKIGEGGFGPVYRATVHLTPVAIKVLDHAGMQGLKEFDNELQLSCSIHHPHVVKLLGFAADGGMQCLVYELMSHGNLEDRLARKGGISPLTWAQRVQVAAQTAYALAYLHNRGITHRDIKPANVFLDCDLNAKLGDIGLASMDGVGRAQQQPSTDAIGTWWYLAPEYKEQGRSSPRTDVYALGLCILQLVTGGAPRDIIRTCQNALEDCTLPQVVDQHAGMWDPRVCERMVKLGLWCCMHDAESRPPAVVAFGELLRMVQALTASGVLPQAAPMLCL